MNHSRRRMRYRIAVGAVTALNTLAVSGPGISTAVAVPAAGSHSGGHAQDGGHGGGHGGGQGGGHGSGGGHGHGGGGHSTDKLDKDIARTDRDLQRVLRKVDRLEPSLAEVVAASVAEDRAALAKLTTRAEVRDVRPENYQRIVAALRKVARLQEQLTAGETDQATLDEVAALVDQLLDLSAFSSKEDVRTLKQELSALKDSIEAETDDDGDESEDGDDGADDGTDDGTGDDLP